jgi:hypothetical protein
MTQAVRMPRFAPWSVHMGQVSLGVLRFSLSTSFHLSFHTCVSSGGWTIGRFMAVVQGHSLTLSMWTSSFSLPTCVFSCDISNKMYSSCYVPHQSEYPSCSHIKNSKRKIQCSHLHQCPHTKRVMKHSLSFCLIQSFISHGYFLSDHHLIFIHSHYLSLSLILLFPVRRVNGRCQQLNSEPARELRCALWSVCCHSNCFSATPTACRDSTAPGICRRHFIVERINALDSKPKPSKCNSTPDTMIY